MPTDKGHNNGMNRYEIMLYNGDEIDTDKKEAARYFKMSADANEGINHYAYMLRYGEGIEVSKEGAADKGDTEALSKYSQMIYNGEDSIKYYKMAFQLK